MEPIANVRHDTAADHAAVVQVHREAFGRDAEATLVDRLRRDDVARISLVAVMESIVIGHALFTEARLAFDSEETIVGALGPVAVSQRHRRRGVAQALIAGGLGLCWKRGWPAVIVLGNPAYYSRFGFTRADTWSIRCELDVPPEAFMIAFASEPIHGPATARYHPAFDDV
jgi:putative acetyltransferase